MPLKILIFIYFLIFILLRAEESSNYEYALGGGYTYFNKKNDRYIDPEPGFIVRIQNGDGKASYLSFISNLEFLMSGKKHGDFKDSKGDDINNVLYDLYLLSYSLGFRISTAPNAFIVPYFGLSGSGSIVTFQFKNKFSKNFPQQQRGFMYGYDLTLGIDLFLNGNKDNGWGFRSEGNVKTLFPVNDFDCGNPQIQTINGLMLLIISI